MNAAQYILMTGVRLYRGVLSPAQSFVFGGHSGCRFNPSCSEYALEALARHGALAGSWLTLKRLARCHPWGGCGYDPVPEQRPTGRGDGHGHLIPPPAASGGSLLGFEAGDSL